jgi:magnesium-transporting ATPase (P-type)
MGKEDERDEKREKKNQKNCHEKLIQLCCWIIRHLEFSFLFFVNLLMIPFFRINNPKKNSVFFLFLLLIFFLPLFSSCFFFNEFLLVKIQICKREGRKPWEETTTS